MHAIQMACNGVKFMVAFSLSFYSIFPSVSYRFFSFNFVDQIQFDEQIEIHAYTYTSSMSFSWKFYRTDDLLLITFPFVVVIVFYGMDFYIWVIFFIKCWLFNFNLHFSFRDFATNQSLGVLIEFHFLRRLIFWYFSRKCMPNFCN